MTAPTGWVFADSWVLAAIGVYQRRCSLLEMVAAGDWMNHAVLEEQEVNEALTKLVGAGLVRIYDDWTFELTDDGASLFSADVRASRSSSRSSRRRCRTSSRSGRRSRCRRT